MNNIRIHASTVGAHINLHILDYVNDRISSQIDYQIRNQIYVKLLHRIERPVYAFQHAVIQRDAGPP